MMVAEYQSHVASLTGLLGGLVADRSIPVLSVTGLSIDSRKVLKGDVFIALQGSQHDGARYINDAINNGAACILIDAPKAPDITISSIPVIAVNELAKKVGTIAARFFQQPSEKIHVTGITGTNGKTTIAWMLSHAAKILGQESGYIGTLGIGSIDRLMPSNHTTPDAITLQMILQQLQQINCQTVYMEVSSHALEQYRVDATCFKQAIFTNLSREHLDYHSNMDAYARSKQRLFSQDFSIPEVILNLDNSYSHDFLKTVHSHATVYGYSLNEYSPLLEQQQQVIASIVSQDSLGTTVTLETPWGKQTYQSYLLGHFNISNLLACMTSLCLSGYRLDEVLIALNQIPQVPGRMERLGHDNSPWVIIDYAHSPAALMHVLECLSQHTSKQLFCVFGCGGNRDLGKRVLMAQAVETYADRIYITSDNPRDEDPNTIIEDILKGIQNPSKVIVESDRSVAIRDAIYQANPGDIVLIAGKGHEQYQEIKGEFLPFNDRQLASSCLEALYD